MNYMMAILHEWVRFLSVLIGFTASRTGIIKKEVKCPLFPDFYLGLRYRH